MGNTSQKSATTLMKSRYIVPVDSPVNRQILDGASTVSPPRRMEAQKMTAEELLDFMAENRDEITKILADCSWKPRDKRTAPLWKVSDASVSTVSIEEGSYISLVECLAVSKFYFDHKEAEFRYHGEITDPYDSAEAEKMITSLNYLIKSRFNKRT